MGQYKSCWIHSLNYSFIQSVFVEASTTLALGDRVKTQRSHCLNLWFFIVLLSTSLVKTSIYAFFSPCIFYSYLFYRILLLVSGRSQSLCKSNLESITLFVFCEILWVFKKIMSQRERWNSEVFEGKEMERNSFEWKRGERFMCFQTSIDVYTINCYMAPWRGYRTQKLRL